MAYTSTLLFIIEGNQGGDSSQVGTWRQELVQRPWRDAAYWLVPHGLLSLSSFKTSSLGIAPPTVGSAFPLQSSSNQRPSKLARRLPDGKKSSFKAFSSQLTLSCVKLSERSASTVLKERLYLMSHIIPCIPHGQRRTKGRRSVQLMLLQARR